MMRLLLPRVLVSALAVLAFALPATALPVGFEMIWSAEDSETGESLGLYYLEDLMNLGLLDETENPALGTVGVELNATAEWPTGWSVTSASTQVKEDPFITNNFVVTNNTGVTTTFTFAVSSPIPAFNASKIVESNILIQLNDDDNAGGATLTSDAPTSVYEAFVNGGSVLTLLDDPYLLTCTSPSDCSPPGVANGQDGDEVIAQAFGPVVATSIGITVKFTLSPGDSAAVLSRFEIVPEPGTALLVGFGLLAMAGARRRAAR